MTHHVMKFSFYQKADQEPASASLQLWAELLQLHSVLQNSSTERMKLVVLSMWSLQKTSAITQDRPQHWKEVQGGTTGRKGQRLLHHMSGHGSQSKMGQTRYLQSFVSGAVCCFCQEKTKLPLSRHQIAKKMQISNPWTCCEQPPICHKVPDKSSPCTHSV